ncbi:MAG: folylpolyglutamate synthase/dihydrofolate synthase family protein [Halieaceae bacterium]|nr:folylpolyglutamate synthase/dihydrofolate synthase family protein [Halieaceae bacterium]
MPERGLGDWLTHLERIHPASIDLGLERVARVARIMGLVPLSCRSVLVAGTNGKGSVVYTCDAVLRAHGQRTGRYTSPHLEHFNERIAVDGAPVGDDILLEAFEAIEAARGETTLTYFEFSTLAALWVFRERAVDVAVLEIGLGGRLDAANIVDADVAVVTSIALDHQQWLGDTVEAIAPEKAAIARAGRPLVLAEAQYPAALFATLKDLEATVLRAGDEWAWSEEEGILSLSPGGSFSLSRPMSMPVPAGLRAANVAAALRAAAVLLGAAFDGDRTRAALTGLRVPARREIRVVDDREVVLDVAHNPAAAEALVEFLLSLPRRPTTAVLGVMSDKDYAAMARSLATCVDGACAVAIPGIERAADPETVWRALDEAGIAIAQSDFSMEAVWRQLQNGSAPGDRLVVCGSFHTVAGILELLRADSRG